MKRRYASAAPEIAELAIDSLANSGDGVGRLDGRVTFVPGTAPGDVARVAIAEVRKNLLRGRLVELVEPSPERVTPPCAVFGTCGGCDWQHVAYAAQLEAKREQLAQTLARVGGLDDPDVAPVEPCPTPYGYRDRIRGTLRDGRLYLHRRGGDARVPAARCEIADERINDWLAGPGSAGIEGRVELALVDGEVVAYPLGDGRDTELGFRQVNPAMAARLEALLIADLAGTARARVVDLYCGRGAWTLAVAAAYPDAKVTGVEVHEGAVEEARRRAREANLSNVGFRQGRVEKLLKGLDLAGGACIVDPPRAGLDERVLARLVRAPAATLLYVSCHPATLARDLKGLGAAYDVRHVQPLDMFPQTAHLECRALLRAR